MRKLRKAKFKKKVNGDVIRRRRETDEKKKKQNQKNYFDRTYDKTRDIHFKNKDEVSMRKHFYMPKFKEEWAFHSLNATAVYPVFCSRADFKKAKNWIQISRENIAKLSGLSAPTVDKGIKYLLNIYFNVGKQNKRIPYLRRQKWKNKRKGWLYAPAFFRYNDNDLSPKQWQNQYFVFHTCIIASGVWAALSRKAKTLYIAMRSKAFFDAAAYEELEGVWLEEPDINTDNMDYDGMEEYFNSNQLTEFTARRWDICNPASIKELFQLADMTYSNPKLLIDELADVGLIEKIDGHRTTFIIYLKPKTFF